MPVAGNSTSANVEYSRAECVFILRHYFALTSFASVCEAFSNAYLGKEVLNKRTIHLLVTKFQDTRSVGVSSRMVDICCKVILYSSQKIETKETAHLFCYIDVTRAYKYCFSLLSRMHFKWNSLHNICCPISKLFQPLSVIFYSVNVVYIS
jgi:hypothetical protein